MREKYPAQKHTMTGLSIAQSETRCLIPHRCMMNVCLNLYILCIFMYIYLYIYIFILYNIHKRNAQQDNMGKIDIDAMQFGSKTHPMSAALDSSSESNKQLHFQTTPYNDTLRNTRTVLELKVSISSFFLLPNVLAKGGWVALSYLKMMGKISEMRRGEQVMLLKK